MSRSPEIRVFFPWRLLGLGLLAMAGFWVLGARLWNLQMRHSAEHSARLARQSLRSVRVPGIRGAILDRNGVALAENRPSYCLSLYPEELRRPGERQHTIDAVSDTLDRLAEVMDRARTLDNAAIRTHLNRRTPLPLVAWRNLDPVAVARFAEHAHEFPGVALTVEPVRHYPEGSLAAHVLGYVGRADEEALAGAESDSEEPETYHFYLPDVVGRSGIEKRFDEDLRAATGGRLELQVDVAGFRYQTLDDMGRPPGRGEDVTLALDVRVQRAAERVLEGLRGAVVVVDPRNGDVLAMASSPGYNPNDFIPSISAAKWKELQRPDRPLLNRATAGEYAPGSTFKPITLMAALKSGKVLPGTVFNCPGVFQLGNAKFHCAQSWGHGNITLPLAIRYSCNVYLFHSALACGPEPIQAMARDCGLGAPTGIDLDYERAGLVPDAVWKRRARNDGWRDGDTCNMSIGQGALLVTPLQLAMYAASLANRGTLWHPRLVLERTRGGQPVPEPVRRADAPGPTVNRSQLEVVRRGMLDVVNAPDGSGRRAKVEGFPLAAKTGTAEYGPKGAGKKWTWMIVFGPYDAPRYAAAFLVEDGESGGKTVAPLVKQFFTEILETVENADSAGEAADAGKPVEGETGFSTKPIFLARYSPLSPRGDIPPPGGGLVAVSGRAAKCHSCCSFPSSFLSSVLSWKLPPSARGDVVLGRQGGVHEPAVLPGHFGNGLLRSPECRGAA